MNVAKLLKRIDKAIPTESTVSLQLPECDSFHLQIMSVFHVNGKRYRTGIMLTKEEADGNKSVDIKLGHYIHTIKKDIDAIGKGEAPQC